jgi:hypothetical protein
MIIAGFPPLTGEQVERHARDVRLRCCRQASLGADNRLSEILLRAEVRSYVRDIG